MQYNLSVPAPQDLGHPHLLYAGKWEHDLCAIPRTLHSHTDSMEFVYVVSGQGICELGGKHHPISSGDLIVYNSGVLHNEHLSPSAISMYCASASGIQLPSLPPNCLFVDDILPIFHLGAKSTRFHRLFDLIVQEAASGDTRSSAVCQSLFFALLDMTLDVIDAHQFSDDPDSKKACSLGERIRSYIDVHINDKLTVPEIARTFGISTSYLARVFKQTCGCSLASYTVRRRIGEAQTLLLQTNLSILEISHQVGYDNQSYFTKQFTKLSGVPPLRYRKLYSTNLQ